MERFLFSTILWILVLPMMAQPGWSRLDRQDLRAGEVAIIQEDYAMAYTILKPLYAKDSTYAPLNLAYGRVVLDWKKDKPLAIHLLRKAVEAEIPEAKFHYARALHSNMYFNEAVTQYLDYIQSGDAQVDQMTVKRYLTMTYRAMDALANPVDVRVSNLGPAVNTAQPEYVPLITPDNKHLYFTSRRPGSTAQLKDPDGKFFEDIYQSTRVDNQWLDAVNVGQPINSETHDATVSISADGKMMVIYRTNENLTGGDLYITEQKNGKWTSPKKLPPTINSAHQEASATLSPDKNMLIFSSNRPGGYGGKDLYRVRRLPNGEWSQPKNLGPVINSPYDEDAPHLDVDGKTLYFASNGHSTIGGYDNFRTVQLGNESWLTPENLGYPVNTVDDDLYLTLDAGGRTGYFSSARPGGFGDQDLYSVDFVYRKDYTVVVKSEVRSIFDEALPAVITIIDESTRQIEGVYRSNSSTGKFIAVLHPVTQYKVIIECPGFESVIDELLFPFPEQGGSPEIDLPPFIMRKP